MRRLAVIGAGAVLLFPTACAGKRAGTPNEGRHLTAKVVVAALREHGIAARIVFPVGCRSGIQSLLNLGCQDAAAALRQQHVVAVVEGQDTQALVADTNEDAQRLFPFRGLSHAMQASAHSRRVVGRVFRVSNVVVVAYSLRQVKPVAATVRELLDAAHH